MDKFVLDTEGTPPSFPGHGSGGSHVSNYPTGNAFEAAIPPVGMNKPVEAPNVVDSTKGMKMRNDTAGDKGEARPLGGTSGASHQVFESLSTDGTGRGISDDKVTKSSSSAGLV